MIQHIFVVVTEEDCIGRRKKKSAHRQPSRTPNKAFYKGLLILTLFSGNVPEMFRKISGNVPGMLLFHALVPEQACSRNVP